MNKKIQCGAVIVALSFLAIACAPRYSVVTKELQSQFRNGTANLDCEIPCLWSWVTNFNNFITLYNSNEWEKLASLVIQVGYPTDLSYFFLGRSAEELGYNDAAVKYYRRSIDFYNDPMPTHHCRDSSTGCGGLNLAVSLPQHISSVQSTTSVASSNGRFIFSIVRKPGQEDSDIIAISDVKISYNGLIVAYGESYLDKDEIVKIYEDTPQRDCQTIVASYYDGSAHNDSEYHMAVSCGSNDYLFYGTYPQGDLKFEDVDNDGVKEMPVYCLYELYSLDEEHCLSFAESPWTLNYAVWTHEGWKNTAPGVLSNAYKNLLNKELRTTDKSVASAVAISYYTLMSGQDAITAKNKLRSRLPIKWKALTNKIFDDIKYNAYQSNLITTIALDKIEY